MSSKRFHRGHDVWGRGSYSIPATAVVGSSYCGEWSDSPARGEDVRREFKMFQRDLKRATGISARKGRATRSGNVFMCKLWLCVPRHQLREAALFARDWLEEHRNDTRLVHDADLDALLASMEA